MKTCSKCKEEKPFDQFHKYSAYKDGYRPECRVCRLSLPWYKESLEKKKFLYHNDDVFRKKRDQIDKDYLSRNREKVRVSRAKAQRKAVRSNINLRIKLNLQRRILHAIKGSNKSARTATLLGCDQASLKTHLESLFQEGMSWDNYGDWQIDHIRPCASFDLSIPEEQLSCFNYKNLQPLWKIDNMIKRDRLDWVKP